MMKYGILNMNGVLYYIILYFGIVPYMSPSPKYPKPMSATSEGVLWFGGIFWVNVSAINGLGPVYERILKYF